MEDAAKRAIKTLDALEVKYFISNSQFVKPKNNSEKKPIDPTIITMNTK
jgi:hypothetical protein